MRKLTLLLVVTIVFFAACRKDSKSTSKTETPIQTTIAQQLVFDSVYRMSLIPWEFGQKFYFSRHGNITKLGCKMPVNGSYRVSLWDFKNKSLIAATMVNVTDPDKFSYVPVSPIPVTANTRYVLSVNNSTDEYSGGFMYLYMKKPGNHSVSIYPFTSGSVTYEGSAEIATSTSLFPSERPTSNWYLGGVTDLQFEYSE